MEKVKETLINMIIDELKEEPEKIKETLKNESLEDLETYYFYLLTN